MRKNLDKTYKNIFGVIYSIIFAFLIILGLALIISTNNILTGIILIIIGVILAVTTRKYWLKWSIYSDPK